MVNVEYGFRRSGNHLLMETIKLNFKESFVKSHAFSDNRDIYVHLFYDSWPKREVFIVRDIRAVLASCYVWWRESGESIASGVRDQFIKYSFEEFVKGMVRIDASRIRIDKRIGVMPYDLERGVITDPLNAWMQHTKGFLNTDMPKVTYESLVSDPRKVIKYLEHELGLTRVSNEYKVVGSRPVGHLPFRTGNWRNYYTPELEAYVLDRVGELLREIRETCI